MPRKLQLVLTFFAILVTFSALPVVAQDATGETIVVEKKTKEEENADQTNQILQNLENLVRDTTSSEAIKNQYDDVTAHARGFVGQVEALKEDSFKIVTTSGEEMLIAPDKSTTIAKKGETVSAAGDFTLSDWIAINDWLVLIGIQNGDNFQPRRIMVSSDSLEPVATFVERGYIKTATASKLDISIVGQAEVDTFTIGKTTNLVDSDNETITYQDLPANSPVLLIGTLKAEKKALQTLRLLPESEATASAQVS